MIKTFKYKLYKSKRNKKLKSLILLSCEIYNHCISLHKRYYKMYHKTLDKNSLQKHLVKLKKREKYKHYNNLNSQSIQEITDRIQRSYTLFFNSLKTKNKRKIKLPGFKSSRKYKSFTLKQSGYKLEDNIITIGKLNFKYFKSRELEGKIKTITIKRDSLGDIYLFFVCEVGNPRLRLMTGKTAGFDFGLKTYLTSNEGAKIESPQFLKQDKQFLKLLSRRVSKKKKGSNNKRKSIKNLNRFYRKLVNKRRDFHFKLSKQLTDQYDELYFESLNIKTMQQIWGRKISDLSFSEFMSILENYCIKTGVKLIKIGRWEATSKTCNNCGYKKDDLTLEDRIWTCPSCKTLHDRDINAAKNIFLVGTSTSKGEEVRLSELTKVSSVKHSSLSL
jgi:putative transposase